jgi:nitrate reductase alpha subunit
VKWIKDLVSPKTRSWEEFYRNRWQHDKVVRSTHGVNCTGGCSWNIYVKEGIVTWEMQALDYPLLDRSIPPYEPRGCQRGISYSWYLYSPIRVKYPYIRGALLDLWKEAKKKHQDPVDAWASLQSDPALRSRYQRARGKGGFRRARLDDAMEIIAAANVHTARKYGPDRVIGFSPIPAMSQLSYAAGSRFLQLFGGVNLSFYDWYCDLPPASPETWGEQTDVAESADWYKSKMIAVMGSNPNMTRTPDCHFLPEARHNGTKLVVLSPDFSQVSKYADQWIPLHAGQDGAFWMAVSHVILKEFYADRPTPAFEAYLKQYSDCPFLVELTPTSRGYRAGRLVHAGQLDAYADEENGDWKYVVLDATTGLPKMPGGAVGHRWGEADGKWNLKLEDAKTGEPIDPVLSLLDRKGEVLQVELEQYESQNVVLRGVPSMTLKTKSGKKVRVTTVFDLLMARYGISRGLAGEYPESYDDAGLTYTPAWQEELTGIDRKTVISFAREWAATAEKTGGKCSIIIGAGINHWYHNNLMYRAGIVALILTGCVGKSGGGLNHYVGQEKLAPVAPWSYLAFARDWASPPRLQNAPSWHYMHCDQWRYEAEFTEYAPVPDEPSDLTIARGHTADLQVKAVKNGWLPFFPQWNESSIEVVKKARAAGARTEAEVIAHAVDRMKSGDLRFAVENPDAPENWPRVWFIWRGNALMSSAKGHEYFLKHYLGTHTNLIATEKAQGKVSDVEWVDAPEGKLDLVVDINFRMDTSALYSDIVLPAATWYEKADLNSTDMHSFIHPLSAAVPPAWESRSDWDMFRSIANKTSELSIRHFPEPVEDLVMTSLQHDTNAEIAQLHVRDWAKGECEPVPGQSMAPMKVVTRDYRRLHQRFTAVGPAMREGIGAHGVKLNVAEQYDELVKTRATVVVDGKTLPSIREAEQAADVILHLAPETNGEVAYDGYRYLEKRTGLKLLDLAEGSRGSRTTYKDLQAQPRRILNSPCWSGLVENGRSYSAFTTQVERLLPWRTLTGRQHLYLDHPGYLDFGEHLPIYKPVPRPAQYGDLRESLEDGVLLNYLTPHGKWHIHSTYSENHRMLTLSRGIEPIWMSVTDAEKIGIVDNDWVEVHNDHGVVCTRAVVSHRIPRGICILYHSPERTIGVPKSPLRGGRRAGGHNSLTRIRLKPVLMVGGYGQFTYHFNYWGPTGVNRDTSVRIRKLTKVEL